MHTLASALAGTVGTWLLLAQPMACAPPTGSGTTCWEKRAYYQARNVGLRETLGSGTRYSAPCVLSAYVAIEQATTEFGVTQHTDTLIRIAACESLLQPGMIGRTDRADIGLFQWNDGAPNHWWTKARQSFNAWQDRHADKPLYATPDRLDPYNAARVAAWTVRVFPPIWPITWHCKGVWNPSQGRLK